MSRENAKNASWREPNDSVTALDGKFDQRHTGTSGRIEPAALISLARTRRARRFAPAPEERDSITRPPREPPKRCGLRRWRPANSEDESAVLFPVGQKDWPFQAWPIYKNVPRRRRLDRSSDNEGKSGGPENDDQSPHATLIPLIPMKGSRGSPVFGHVLRDQPEEPRSGAVVHCASRPRDEARVSEPRL